MKLKAVFILFLFCQKLYAQPFIKIKGRAEKQNEIYISTFRRNNNDIYISLGYERNLFKIFRQDFISLQGEYSRGLFEISEIKYQYFLIAPKYNSQNGRIVTSLYPMFGYSPAIKRGVISLNASNKFDYTKLKLTFSVNLALEAISYPPTSFPLGNANPTYVRTWHRYYRLGLSIGKYF